MAETSVLDQIGDMAQILTAFITLIAITLSAYFSVKALKEVQKDRALRHRPILAFEPGPWPLTLEKGSEQKLPGLNSKWVKEVLKDLLPQEQGFLHLPSKQDYGCLRNYGTGPALSVAVYWSANEVALNPVSNEKRRLLIELGRKDFNTIPSSPNHIIPNQHAAMTRLPSFILADYGLDIKRVRGVLVIEYRDIFGKTHKTKQEFRIFTDYKMELAKITVTFARLIDDERDNKNLEASKNNQSDPPKSQLKS